MSGLQPHKQIPTSVKGMILQERNRHDFNIIEPVDPDTSWEGT